MRYAQGRTQRSGREDSCTPKVQAKVSFALFVDQ